MKKILLISLLFAACKSKTPKVKPDSIDKDATLQIPKVKYTDADSAQDASIAKYDVKLLSGKPKYRGKTIIFYLNTLQQINIAKKKGEKQMWTPTKLQNHIDNYKDFAIGGIINIDIERITIDAANMKMFTIIIKDTAGVELFRKELESSIADVPMGGSDWSNLDIIEIGKKIRPPFDIFVIDKMEDLPFKFRVSVKK